MKKFSIVDGERVRKHVLNTSASKLTYSFSRDQRFRSPLPNCPSVCYENVGKLSKRAAGFGFGDRSDFTKTLTSSPPVTKYNPEQLILSTKKSSPSKTFGNNRDKSPHNGIIKRGVLKNPGVGTYDLKQEPTNNFSYTMRSRTLDVILKNNTSKASPGPAAYKQTDEFPHSKFFQSKHENPPLGHLSRTARFTTPKQTPGPQTYLATDNLSNRGNQGNRKFSLSSRTGFTQNFAQNKSMNPGPGRYQLHSEFGAYGDTNYYKTLSSFSKISNRSRINAN